MRASICNSAIASRSSAEYRTPRRRSSGQECHAPRLRDGASLNRQPRAAVPTMRSVLVQEVLAVKRVTLGGAEAGAPGEAAGGFFRGAVGGACRAGLVFFEDHGAD